MHSLQKHIQKITYITHIDKLRSQIQKLTCRDDKMVKVDSGWKIHSWLFNALNADGKKEFL